MSQKITMPATHRLSLAQRLMGDGSSRLRPACRIVPAPAYEPGRSTDSPYTGRSTLPVRSVAISSISFKRGRPAIFGHH